MIENRLMGKVVFWAGAVIDGGIAISWFLIAAGFSLPNILNGYISQGADYQLAMFIGALFMSAWTVLLIWGAMAPGERKGLLMITAIFLLLSVGLEVLFYHELLASTGFYFGCTKRVLIAVVMVWTYRRLGRG